MSSKPSKELPIYTCIYCNREFVGWQALVAHLGHCPKRILSRFFEIDDYCVTLYLNPRHRYVDAFKRLALEHPDDPKIFLGAIFFAEFAGIIATYKIAKINDENLSRDVEKHETGNH